MKVKAAISQRHEKNKYGARMDCLENAYTEYFQKHNITLIPVSNALKNVEEYLGNLEIDGIILSGGNNISPKEYGINIDDKDASRMRDRLESEMIRFAIKKKIPLLGICRGMQMINVFFGGKLNKEITSTGEEHAGTLHEVKISANNIGIKEGAYRVNSYHNEGVTDKEISAELRVFARTNKVVEGVYHPKHKIIGIQWHPEREGCEEEINEQVVKAFKEGKA